MVSDDTENGIVKNAPKLRRRLTYFKLEHTVACAAVPYTILVHTALIVCYKHT
jgi:hypothetical protein